MNARTAPVFERLADRYDRWYQGPAGRVALPMEVDCNRPLLAGTVPPRLEVGVGSGRFARALGIGVGLDPALAPLHLARDRGVGVVGGVGERLPFPDRAFGAMLVVVTLCFADDPGALLAEAKRVLRPGAPVVVGVVLADSPWGRWYRIKGAGGHPFYAAARFLSRGELGDLLEQAGFQVTSARSVLLQAPTQSPCPEPVLDGEVDGAGFVCLKAV